MTDENIDVNGDPQSIGLSGLKHKDIQGTNKASKFFKSRIIYITLLAVLIACLISVVAFLLMELIFLISNICFYGEFTFNNMSPALNHLGLWVIAVPTIGGLLVGFFIRFGSKDIRGHGIPEAMEQVLTNKSKINPILTYLKPIASAIAIGTGGPFGAEGPIISTGGAFGSTLGQILKISTNERKILLAAGSAAGMAAIFGTPIASIFLAIELLLFEFSPRSIIPTAMACIVGAAGHYILFPEMGTNIFKMNIPLAIPGYKAILIYLLIGLLIGVISVGVSKSIYFFEDLYNRIPIHFMWYPAIGAVIVGLIGYFYPNTLGVGYDNITDLLNHTVSNGSMTLQVIIGLCVMKYLSWSISLASGTAGGTLAPLFIIGGATGSLLGLVFMHIFPGIGISLPLASLLGMAAMFSGASRAVLTSIIFAVESTGEANALLPLLAGCLAAYLVSYLMMDSTIMTEKIARRGVKVPDSYSYDSLEEIYVGQFIKADTFAISQESTIADAREWLYQFKEYKSNYFIVTDENGKYIGLVSSSTLFGDHHQKTDKISTLVNRRAISISKHDNLRKAVEIMVKENIDVIPVVEYDEGIDKLIGALGYQDIFDGYRLEMDKNHKKDPDISIKNNLKILLKGNKLKQK